MYKRLRPYEFFLLPNVFTVKMIRSEYEILRRDLQNPRFQEIT